MQLEKSIVRYKCSLISSAQLESIRYERQTKLCVVIILSSMTKSDIKGMPEDSCALIKRDLRFKRIYVCTVFDITNTTR